MTFGILALGFPVSEDLGGFAAFGGSQSHFLPYLPYLNAFLRWRLASWLWGSLFRRIWGVSQPLGAHSFAAFGGSQSHFLPYLPYLNAFLRWRLASWRWGSLFRRIWGVSQPLGAHSLTFFLIFPILMHSLGDVWHPGSGVPCFGGFKGFRSLWGLTVSLSSLFLPYLPYLNAVLRWRLASWLWGSLFRRIWGVSQPLGAHSLTFFLIFPILMHSLGDVWYPSSGVPCFGGFGGFRSLWGLTVSLSSLFSLS